MKPSDHIKRMIEDFAADWTATERSRAKRRTAEDMRLLADEITRIVDEAVREAILTTASVLRDEK